MCTTPLVGHLPSSSHAHSELRKRNASNPPRRHREHRESHSLSHQSRSQSSRRQGYLMLGPRDAHKTSMSEPKQAACLLPTILIQPNRLAPFESAAGRHNGGSRGGCHWRSPRGSSFGRGCRLRCRPCSALQRARQQRPASSAGAGSEHRLGCVGGVHGRGGCDHQGHGVEVGVGARAGDGLLGKGLVQPREVLQDPCLRARRVNWQGLNARESSNEDRCAAPASCMHYSCLDKTLRARTCVLHMQQTYRPPSLHCTAFHFISQALPPHSTQHLTRATCAASVGSLGSTSPSLTCSSLVAASHWARQPAG